MRAVGSIAVVFVMLLAGCGAGGSSTSTAGISSSEQAKPARTSSSRSASAHATSQGEPENQRKSEAPAGEAEEAPAEVKEDEAGKSVSDDGSYNGIDLCDLDQIEEEVRALYEVAPETEVICKPAESQANVVAAWNWWVVQPKQSPRHFPNESPQEEETAKMSEELVGEKAPGYRVEIGIGKNQVGNNNVWATEKAHVFNPANELDLIEVNGREAIWGANYLLLTQISEDENLVIATLSGYTENGPTEGEPTAVALAELVEHEAF